MEGSFDLVRFSTPAVHRLFGLGLSACKKVSPPTWAGYRPCCNVASVCIAEVNGRKKLGLNLQQVDEDGFWDVGGTREEAGDVGGGCRAGDGRLVGAGQLPQQQLQQARAAVLRVLHANSPHQSDTQLPSLVLHRPCHASTVYTA